MAKKGKKAKKRRSDKSFDYETAVEVVTRGVVERLGLDYLNLSVQELKDIIEPIIIGIVESRKTKPSMESLIKRIVNNKRLLYKAIAAKLLDKEELTLEQLEFIIANAPELAGRAAPLLYRVAVGHNADYLIDSLRYLWMKYGKPTRIRCPYCGFYSVTPDLHCMICGREVDENDLKTSINFTNILIETVKQYDRSLIEEILRAGFVIYDGGIYPPSMKPLHREGIILFLSSREKKLLESLLEETGST